MADFGKSIFENARQRPLVCAHRGANSYGTGPINGTAYTTGNEPPEEKKRQGDGPPALMDKNTQPSAVRSGSYSGPAASTVVFCRYTADGWSCPAAPVFRIRAADNLQRP